MESMTIDERFTTSETPDTQERQFLRQSSALMRAGGTRRPKNNAMEERTEASQETPTDEINVLIQLHRKRTGETIGKEQVLIWMTQMTPVDEHWREDRFGRRFPRNRV